MDMRRVWATKVVATITPRIGCSDKR